MVSLSDFTIDTSGTAQDVQRRQKLADALMQQGSDSSPAAGGRNGGWITALNRGLAGALSGYQRGQADQISQGARQADQSLLASYPGMNGSSANPVASMGAVPAALTKSAPQADASPTKVYSPDELNPMDEPRGDARTKYIATLLGEEKPGSPEGLGVANTIRNRAVDGGYGGDSPDAVVQAPSQYSPWNDAAGRARMARALQNPADVAKANDQIDQTYGVGKYAAAGPNDPTEGKTHFYDPASMVPANAVPKWAQGREGQKIGQTMFYDDPDSTPQNAQMAQGALPTQAQVAQAAPQVAQDDPQAAHKQELMAWARNAAMSQNPSIRQMGIQTLEQLSKPEPIQSIGEGYIVRNGKIERAYNPEDKTPASKLEYDAYAADEKTAGRSPISYGQFLNKNGTAGGAGPDTSTLMGDDFLKTLPKGEADLVKKIAEYDIDPKTLSTKGGHREDLLKKVSQYDSDYSEPLYASRKAAIKEFGAGGPSSPAGQITAGNTAILHAGEMSDALENLKKKSSGPLGYVGESGIPFASYYASKMHNAGITGTGTEEARALSEFRTAKNHFSEEVTKFYAGSGGSESERERALANIDEAKSLPELQSAIQQEARLMGGKINTLQDRIKTAMGPSAWKRAMKEAGGQFPIVQQQSADQLAKIEKRASGQSSSNTDVDPAALAEAKRRGLIP